jgi:hypothetical protein
MKKAAILLFALVIASCKQTGTIHPDPDHQVIRISSTPAVTLKYTSDEESAMEAAKFTLEAMNVLNGMGAGRSDPIDLVYTGNEDPYELFFMLGDAYFNGYKNKPLVYGLINLEWQKRVENGDWKDEAGSLTYGIRLPEMQKLVDDYGLDKKQKNTLYLYVNSFLLREIYFVSVQEMMERGYLYFTPAEVENVFFQSVILVEMTEFARFLSVRFGYGKTMKLAKEAYSREFWQANLGEGVPEVENDFVVTFEEMKLEGVLADSNFIGEIDKLLTLYNTGTKTTLFQRSRQ